MFDEDTILARGVDTLVGRARGHAECVRVRKRDRETQKRHKEREREEEKNLSPPFSYRDRPNTLPKEIQRET